MFQNIINYMNRSESAHCKIYDHPLPLESICLSVAYWN